MAITIVTRAVKGSPLNATEHDANLNNLAAAIENVTTGHDHDGGDSKAIPLSVTQGQAYAADSAASDTYVVTLSPVPAAYFNGMKVIFKATTINTGAATLNVNGLGAIAINKYKDQAPEDGDIEAGQMVEVIYNSTGPRFEMVNPPAQYTGSGVPVRAISPALVTPALGTPASGNLANCSGFPSQIAASISDGDTTHAPDGNSVFDGLALKPNLASANSFTNIAPMTTLAESWIGPSSTLMKTTAPSG